MNNPFEEIQSQLEAIRAEIASLRNVSAPPSEIIDRKELMKRLGMTEPTIVRYTRRGAIPEIKVGGQCRYNWPSVVAALERPGFK